MFIYRIKIQRREGWHTDLFTELEEGQVVANSWDEAIEKLERAMPMIDRDGGRDRSYKLLALEDVDIAMVR